MRGLARRVLEAHGYRVFEAADGLQALELTKQHGVIDLLVVDVVMPHMNGPELAAAIAALVPGIRTLYVSGYIANTIARQGVVDSKGPFLEKPFTPASLASKVREVLTAAKE